VRRHGAPPSRTQAVPQVDQRSLAVDLVSSDEAARQKALSAIARIPPTLREQVVVEAIVREVDRLHRIGGTDVSDSIYYGGLLDAVLLADDPVVIRPLVDAIVVHGVSGRPVLEGLAKFGQPAATSLLEAVQKREPVTVTAVCNRLWPLQVMVEVNATTLSGEWRSRAAALAEPCLTGRNAPESVESGLGLVRVLRDPRFIPRLTEIARARTAAEAGLTLIVPNVPNWPDKFPALRAIAADTLARLKSGK